MRVRSKWMRMVCGVSVLIIVFLSLSTPCPARVKRIEILERQPFAGGIEFGTVGPYERIKGRLYYAVDPDNRFNRQIVDIQLAKKGQLHQDVSEVNTSGIKEIVGGDARNAAGEVEFWGDFMLLKPVDLTKGNHRILYDVNNRGNLQAMAVYNDVPNTNNPITAADAGNGWLMREGYSVLWTAWNWDVESTAGTNPQRIFLPIIVNPDGSSFIERINAEITVQIKDNVKFDWLAWGGSRCYSVADDPALQQAATLTVRDLPDVDDIGPRTLIPRTDWQFAKLDANNNPIFSAVQVYYPKGFEKGRIYEVLYDAKNPRVVGLGLAAIRDAISFFHFEIQDDYANPNPLAVSSKNSRKMRVDPKHAYIFGVSQSGRVITTMIYQGFHVDEKGRMVFEGARPDVPGGGKGAFNYRWAQTTHHPKHIEANYFPADHFPFNFMAAGKRHMQIDPYRIQDGGYGNVLAVANALHRVPKIMLDNHETEYWTRAASLVHTDVFGWRDVGDVSHPYVRFYAINGSQHGAPTTSSVRTNANDQHSDGFVNNRPVQRALLVALDRWVTDGIEPPPTTVPQIYKGELVTAEEHKAAFPKIPAYTYNGVTFPAVRHPGTYLKPPRADYGPDFFMPMPQPWDDVPVAYPGIQDDLHVPPRYFGPAYETRVPYFDADGNGIGGIRMTELTVPLGTYQGFNPRCDNCGAPNFIQPFNVSFWPFALTEVERIAKKDPRPSIEKRYGSKADYVAQVKGAAAKLQEQGFTLEEDELATVAQAEKMVWPPVPTNGYPFWKMTP